METREQPLRVALITGSGGLDRGLRQFLQHSGVEVVTDHALEVLRPEQITAENIDVLLVDLEDPLGSHLQRLNWLVGQSQVPILFNAARGAPLGDSGNTLIAKVAHLARNPISVRRGNVARIPAATADLNETPIASVKPKLRVVTPTPTSDAQPADQVWVLGASLGGPKSVTRFLQALPAELPLAFIYTQHIGANFIPVLTKQMEKITSLHVVPAKDGALLEAGQVVVAPATQRFEVSDQGIIELHTAAEEGAHSPSIDGVMSEIAKQFGQKAGAIIFSGMGDDGARGAQEIAQMGGTVWAQDAQSCQISTMPDVARSMGVVSFSAAPEQLAAQLVEKIHSDGIKS